MTVPTNIRMNLNAPFPSLVTGSGPISVGKQNGIWQIGYSIAGLAIQPQPPAGNLATDYVLVWDSVAQTFVQVPLSALAGGGAKLLNTMVANNSATLADLSSFPLGYNEYDFVFENIVPSVNTGVSLQAQVHVGGAYRTTGYLNSAGGLTTCVDILQAATLGNAVATGGYTGTVRVFSNPFDDVTIAMFRGGGVFSTTTSTAAAAICAGYLNNPLAINGVQFLLSTGNITSGTIKVYGFA